MKSPKVGNSNIGEQGNPGGERTTSEGPQWPHLPSAESHPNANLGSTSKKSGQVHNTTKYIYPEMPTERPSGFKRGK